MARPNQRWDFLYRFWAVETARNTKKSVHMLVRRLQLNRFRNYRELDFVPGEGLNLLYGANAQGKSNILEAISLLATTRSLRAGRESELILRGADEARVTAEIDREREGDVELQVSVFEGDKKMV